MLCRRGEKTRYKKKVENLCWSIKDLVFFERLMNATECGRKGGTAPYLHQGDTKIVGGVEALENEFPWQVAIMTENDTWRGCGAILISCDPVVVVSAAHCLTGLGFFYR